MLFVRVPVHGRKCGRNRERAGGDRQPRRHPISAPKPAARKNGRNPRLSTGVPCARDAAAERLAAVRLPWSSEYPSMRAGDRTEDRDGPRREQDAVDARKPDEEGGRILSRHRGDACLRQRLDDENDRHE